MGYLQHQYIERETSQIKTEKVFGDRIVNFVYSTAREHAPALFKAVTSARTSALLGFLNYDVPLGSKVLGTDRFVKNIGVDLNECADDPASLNTPWKIFERKIRYWEVRPMSDNPRSVVSPADAKVLVGSFSQSSKLFLKGKFFEFEELLGQDKNEWLEAFHEGDYTIFRLTPEKYHYNHSPVTGRVVDVYQIPGGYHSCNPNAAVHFVTPFSKNKRVVTIIDTDIPKGSQCGLVVMIEIAALMIGDIVQCYSDNKYDTPRMVTEGMVLQKGQPKSLYRPGSSTDVVIFQKEKVAFSEDIVANMHNHKAESRFSIGFRESLVETEVKVRSEIATVNGLCDND